MALKQLLGKILADMGFVTQQQLDVALKKQMEVSERKVFPERLKRPELVAEARFSGGADTIPLLGELLINMGYVNRSQLDKALEKQEDLLQKYCSLESNSLCSVLDMGALVNSSLNLVEVLSLIMKSANKVTRSVASTLMLVEDRTGELIFSVPTGPEADTLVDIRVKPGRGIAGWVAEHEEPVIVPDVNEDPRFYPGVDKMTGFITKSILAVPLKAKAKLIGVLEVINKEDGTSFTEEDALLLRIFASQAAMAIENARLYGELKDQLEESRRMEKELADSEKFRALGQLSAGVAHDFNNILGAIMGYAEMAVYDIEDRNQVRLSLEQVLKASGRAKDLVNQILAFSRQSEPKKIPVKSDQIVKEALKLFRASLPTTIEIRHEIASDAGKILADSTQIHQVLMNLCANALHAIGEKEGMLDISLASEELSPGDTTAYPDLSPGPYVKMCISDNGCGMDQCTLDQIFEPYYTTKEKGVGTGMGLAVVHGIVKSHGGAISVCSEPDKGTTFEILFPKIDLEIEDKAEVIETLPTGNERIIFVDDEEVLVDLGKKILDHLGYKVTTSTSSVKALEIFRAHPDGFDLVITDMTMPGITGDQLAKEIKKIRPDIGVILCTGFSERINEEITMALGIQELLMKPIVMRDLARTVRKVLDEK